MEPGGGANGNVIGGNGSFYYYSSYGRAPAAAGGSQAASAWEAEGAAEPAAPGARRGVSESALPRGLGRRALSALGPSTNLKILLERDLSKERHELLKDQRLFRNRARKHFLETNKRRRALEEKWKDVEEKEQKFREQILLQRKLKHQEATERFQRGHIPLSQRKKVEVQRKPEPKLDEALKKIQVTGLHLSPSKVIGRAADTTSSATRNDPFSWKQSSVKAGCDRIMQENSGSNPDNSQLLFQQNLNEMQQQLQEQHFSNLQDFHQEVNEIAHTESVCSVDSLEAAEPNEGCTTPSETSSLSAQLDSSVHNSEELQTRNKSFSDETDMTLSKNQHVNNWLTNLNTSNFQTTSPFRDILIKYNVIPSDEDTCSPDQKSFVQSRSEQRETARDASDENLTFAQNEREEKSFLSKRPSSGTEGPVATDSPVHEINKAWAVPDPTVVSLQERNSQLPQNRTSSAQVSCQQTATPVVFPTAPYNNSFSINCMEKGNDHSARCTEDIDCVTNAKHEKVVASLFEEMCKGCINQQNANGDNEMTKNSLSMSHEDSTANLSDLDQQGNNSNEEKVVKFPKSILKKESKYELSNFKAVVVNRGVRFGTQPVIPRDSIELAKMKGKDAEQKNYKKLRWFDEINRAVGDEKHSEQNIIEIPHAQPRSPGSQIRAATSRTNVRSIPACTLNSVFPEYLQENSQASAKIASVKDSDNGMQNAFVSKGYHVARQAWMAPRGEEIPLIYNCELKNPKSNPCKSRTKLIKRPKSAKATSTFTTKNRKGTIIRPQSASEATKVMKTQGKIMAPHPPSKPIPGKKMDENPADSVSQSGNLWKAHTDTENSHFLPEGQDLCSDTTDSPSSGTACNSQVATMRPSYSIFTYELLRKKKATGQAVARCNSFPKGNSVYSENGLCRDRTPTDEEITVLWQGVHRALAQKDGAAGDSQHGVTLCNNSNNGDLQPTRTNVAHITIDGGNLMGSIKSGVRVNPIFASPPSTTFAMTRRKQSIENNENKRKALLEQRRQKAASAVWKPTSVVQNTTQTVKRGPPHCANDIVQAMGGISNSDEVSDSTTQFMLAENLANTSATESDILIDLDTVQPYKQTTVLNRPARQGMSALSFEEHKVLQSLDRINQKLLNVHETMKKIPSSTNVLQTLSPLVASPSYMDIIPTMQRYKSTSGDPRNLTQRRY
ncbi:centrosomal protein of 126 kDa isoform X1 [Podarcis muralis]